jgi:hypothetical protein
MIGTSGLACQVVQKLSHCIDDEGDTLCQSGLVACVVAGAMALDVEMEEEVDPLPPPVVGDAEQFLFFFCFGVSRFRVSKSVYPPVRACTDPIIMTQQRTMCVLLTIPGHRFCASFARTLPPTHTRDAHEYIYGPPYAHPRTIGTTGF